MSKQQFDRDAILNLSRSMAKGAAPKPAPTRETRTKADRSKTDFATLDLYQQIAIQRQMAEKLQTRDPYFALHETRAGATTIVNGKRADQFRLLRLSRPQRPSRGTRGSQSCQLMRLEHPYPAHAPHQGNAPSIPRLSDNWLNFMKAKQRSFSSPGTLPTCPPSASC